MASFASLHDVNGKTVEATITRQLYTAPSTTCSDQRCFSCMKTSNPKDSIPRHSGSRVSSTGGEDSRSWRGPMPPPSQRAPKGPPATLLNENDFVVVAGTSDGYGKVISVSGGNAEVEYFISPVGPQTRTISVPIE